MVTPGFLPLPPWKKMQIWFAVTQGYTAAHCLLTVSRKEPRI